MSVPAPFHSRHAPHRYRLAIAALILVAIGLAVVVVRQDRYQSSPHSNTVQGSGTAATQTRALASFRSVELAGANEVTVHVGGRQAVVVRGDDNLLRRVTTRVQAGALVVGNVGSFTTKSPLSVEVTVRSLNALTLSGSGILSAEGIRAPRLTVTLPGSGLLRASGTVTRLDVTLGGSGDGQLDQLVARDVRAVLSGSGRLLVQATRALDAFLPGTGVIVYRGNPAHVTTSITGSGTVTRG